MKTVCEEAQSFSTREGAWRQMEGQKERTEEDPIFDWLTFISSSKIVLSFYHASVSLLQ